jgi:hypothetical protein
MKNTLALSAAAALGIAAGLMATTDAGFATTPTLTSSSSGIYDYGLVVDASGVTFDQHQTITLSGLSGVTGASVSGDLSFAGFSVSSFTSDSVVFAQGVFGSSGFAGPSTFGTFVIDSSVLTTGTVAYSMETDSGTLSGTVDGPVASIVARTVRGR